jgi:hypothetical protein
MRKLVIPLLVAAGGLGAISALNIPLILVILLSLACAAIGAYLGTLVANKITEAINTYSDQIVDHEDEYENSQYRSARTWRGTKKDDEIRRGSLAGFLSTIFFLAKQAWKTSPTVVIATISFILLSLLIGTADSNVLDGIRNGIGICLAGAGVIAMLEYTTRRTPNA